MQNNNFNQTFIAFQELHELNQNRDSKQLKDKIISAATLNKLVHQYSRIYKIIIFNQAKRIRLTTLALLRDELGWLKWGGGAAAPVDGEAVEETEGSRVKTLNPKKRRTIRRIIMRSWIQISHGTLKLSTMNSSPIPDISCLWINSFDANSTQSTQKRGEKEKVEREGVEREAAKKKSWKKESWRRLAQLQK